MKRWLAIVVLVCAWSSRSGAEPEIQPILRAALSETSAVPGQAISLEITVLVPTWMPEPPELPSFELPGVMVRLPEGSSHPAHERIEGETWSGVTRAYQLHPMRPGRFRIPPQTVTVTFADPDTRAPIVAVFRTEAFEFRGRTPTGAEGLDPFVASFDLALEEELDGDPEDLVPGGAVTRRVTARIEGASPVFLPALVAPIEGDGFAAYPKEPVFEEEVDGARLSGVRVEEITYVAERGGRAEMPPVRVRWWNLETEEVEVSELPAIPLAARGPLLGLDASSVEPREWAAWGIAAALLLTAAGLVARRVRAPLTEWSARRREALVASEGYAFRQVERALRERRLPEVLRALDGWLVRVGASSGPERDGALEALVPLGARLYGRDPSSPDPEAWPAAAAALRALRRSLLRRQRARASDPLPRLNPGGLR